MKHAQLSEKPAGFQDSIQITKVDASGGTLLRGLAECVNNRLWLVLLTGDFIENLHNSALALDYFS